MIDQIALSGLDDYFKPLRSRRPGGIYFYRFNGYNDEIGAFLSKYYNAARQCGVIIEDRIPNPDNKNLSYYNEMLGSAFRMDKAFMAQNLKKWIPRMGMQQVTTVSSSIYDMLSELAKQGKNEGMLKNAYIKFMCWLYYKFERILNRLGGDEVPKLLYQGTPASYEFMMIRIIAGSGCDVVMLQYSGDAEYKKLDPSSAYSREYSASGLAPFPAGFSVKSIRENIEKQANLQMLYGPAPSISGCTNAWVKGKGFDDLKTPLASRGTDPKLFYNCFFRMNGVPDKITYLNDLYRYQLEVKNSGRKIVIMDDKIPVPTFDEIAKVKKGNYTSADRLIRDMASNVTFPQNLELQKLMNKVFVDVMLELSGESGVNINRLTNKAVYMICWLKRYAQELFTGWKMPDVSVFVYLGGCRDEHETAFLKLLSRLPVDVLILIPDKNKKGILEDKLLLDLDYEDSMAVAKFPTDASSLRVGTVAYHAEKELDKIMYEDSGMYRDQQYGKADALVLKTMYEEIDQLWKLELKFRPNFNVENNVVTVPVIFSKICGVKDNDVENYWVSVKRLFTPDTLVFYHFPIIQPGAPNPMKSVATEFFKNGRLQRDVIKRHSMYKYGMLRDEAQNHILDKLQILINERFIQGTFENGTEYTIVSTVLNLDKTIVRLIQKFDFTKVNPKIICLSLDEQCMSLEDTIFLKFLSLIGFDVAVFVPTGYQTMERFFAQGMDIFDSHQIGTYMYDLKVPNFNRVSDKPVTHKSWHEKLFKRGK